MQNPSNLYSNIITIVKHTIRSPQDLQAFLQRTLFSTPAFGCFLLGLGAVLGGHSCQALQYTKKRSPNGVRKGPKLTEIDTNVDLHRTAAKKKAKVETLIKP